MGSITAFDGDALNTITFSFLNSTSVHADFTKNVKYSERQQRSTWICVCICKCAHRCVDRPEDYYSKIVGHKSPALKLKPVIVWHLWWASYLFLSSQAQHACVPQRPQRLQRTLMRLFPLYCRFLGWWQNVLGSSSCAQECPLEECHHCCVRLTTIRGHKHGFVPHLKRLILQGHKEWTPSWRTSDQYILPSPVKRWVNNTTLHFCNQMSFFPFFFQILSYPNYCMIIIMLYFYTEKLKWNSNHSTQIMLDYHFMLCLNVTTGHYVTHNVFTQFYLQ